MRYSRKNKNFFSSPTPASLCVNRRPSLARRKSDARCRCHPSFESHHTRDFGFGEGIVEKSEGAEARPFVLKPRGIDVEKSRPGARRQLRLGSKKPVELEKPPPTEERPTIGEAAPVEGRATSQPAAAEPDPPSAPATEISRIIGKANDLDAIKKAVDDAASVSGGLWLSYLFVLFYLAIAAGAVTNADLFFENPVKLPFLNVELPLLAFFFLAPILFLIVHAYTLVHLVMLTDKAKRFNRALHEKIGDEKGRPKSVKARRAARAALRGQLPSNIFVQFLAGPREIREKPFGRFLQAIAWVTLAVAPVLLLLMMQIQFLPFHNSFITWSHRVVLLLDIGLMSWLWGKILSGHVVGNRPQTSLVWLAIASVLIPLAVLLSCVEATFPGEWLENLPSQRLFWFPFPKPDRELVTLNRLVFQSDVDRTTRRRRLPFSNTLVLPGLNIYEGLNIDDPDKLKGRDFVFRARGRDLRGAIFDFASLPRVDFTGANLEGGSLKSAQLDRASFDGAQLQGASLVGAHLEGASLRCQELQGHEPRCADLQGARLQSADLQGASLRGAQLQGARLENAQLQGARLQGVSLGDAKLQGATLDDAQLQGAVLDSAQLQGTSLNGAQLQGASLEQAALRGASLQNTQVHGARLDYAQLQGASLFQGHLESASLVGAWLQGASLEQAALRGASLQHAFLESTDLSNASFWNANWRGARLKDIRLAGAPDAWWPSWQDSKGVIRPWNDEAYRDLRQRIDSVPPSGQRDQALDRTRSLGCVNADPTIASCDPHALPPPDVMASREALEAARVDDNAYAEALAKTLKRIVCPAGEDTTYVVRADGFQRRLVAAGAAAIDLIDDLANKDSKDCPVAATLTDADRAKLSQIKQNVDKASK
jgi:uncharacterized protein YjbI with pentapeptide repeats